MPQDIASLGISVDSTQAKDASKDLDALRESGGRAEQALSKLELSAKDAMDGLSGTGAASESLSKAAGSASELGKSAKSAVDQVASVGQQAKDVAKDFDRGAQSASSFAKGIEQGIGRGFKSVAAGMGPAARVAAAGIVPLGTAVIGIAAAVGVLAEAYNEGSLEADGYAKAITLSGNASGVTAGQLAVMAASIKDVTNTQAAAAAALTKMAETGSVAGENLARFSAVAVDLERTVGISVEATVKNFEALGRNPVAASERLNQASRYLTLEVYNQIKALEKQGQTAEAAAIAQNAYAEEMEQVSNTMRDRIGVIEGAWRGVKDWAARAWDEMLGIGRGREIEERLSAAKKLLSEMEGGGGKYGIGFTQAQQDAQRALVATLQQFADADAKWAKVDAERRATQAAGIDAQREIDRIMDRSLSKQQRMNKELDKYRRLVGDALKAGSPMTGADVAAGEAAIRAKYADKSGNRGAAAAVRAQVQADLADTKRDLLELTSAYSAAETILEAQRSAGIAGDKEYYEAKRAFIQLNTRAQIDALEKENEILASSKGSSAEKIRYQSQIADNEARIGKLRAGAAASTEALGVKEKAAMDAVAASYLQAEQAARAYLKTISLRQERELAGMGRGQDWRDRVQGLQGIDDQYQSQRDALNNSRALLEMEGKFTAEARAQYEKRLGVINWFNDQARQGYLKYWEERKEKEADFALGAQEGLNAYLDSARNVYKQISDAVSNAFSRMEDALVQFVTTGKIDFRSLANSILADIARIEAKRFISSLIGSTSGEGFGSSIVSLVSSIFGGGRADGGPVEAGKAYLVGEKGVPELFWPGMSGQITQAGGVNVNIRSVISAAPGTDQAALKTYLDYRDNQLKADILDGMRRGRYVLA